MTRVDFLRHGETEAGDRMLGRTDAPLSATGRASVERVAGRFQWQSIVSSPLKRATETAAIAAGGDTSLVEVEDAWREFDFGAWEGQSRSVLSPDARYIEFSQDPEAAPPPGGETMASVRARLTPALERLAERAPGPILVVAHGGTIRMALSILLAIPLAHLWAVRIAPATRISVDMGRDPMHGLWGEIVEITQPMDDFA